MSKYNVNIAMTATLTVSDITEMVRKVVEEETGRQVDKVYFKIREVDCGDCRESVMVQALEGCTVSFTGKPVPLRKPFDSGSYFDR